MTSFDDSNSTDAPPAPQKRSSPSGIAATFAIIAVFALFFGNLAFWIRQDVYDTATVIAKAQTITGTTDTQAAVTALFDETVVHPALEQATGTLPTILQGLAETAVEPVATVIDHAVASAVASQSAQEITTRLVKVINQELVSGTGAISLTPTELLGVLAPSLTKNMVVSKVVDIAESSGCCEVVLAQRSDLPFVWQHVSTIRIAGVLLPLMALASGIVAIALARRRAQMAMGLSGAIAAVGAVTLLALAVGVKWGVRGIGDPSKGSTVLVRQASRITFDVTVGDLRSQCWLLIVVGALIAVIVTAVTRRNSRQPDLNLQGE